jgi:hypothetical protein
MSFQAYGGDPPGMSGLMHYGNAGLGWLGSLVPTAGVSFPSLLHSDVLENGWQAREVRWRHTGGTLPLLLVAEDGSIYHPPMPDGTYYATGIVSVDGEDVGTSTVTVTWGTTLGGGLRIVRMSPLHRTVHSMARRPEILEDMDVDEEDNITFTFADELGDGETVAEAVTKCEIYSGTDATPDLRDGSRQITSPTVKQRIVNPTSGVVYLVSCLATTNLSRKLRASGYVRGVKLS